MSEYDDLPYIVIERRSAGLAPFLWGALLGAGAALLLAPRSGEDTQRELRENALRLRRSAEGRANEAREMVERSRQQVQGRIDAVRGAINTGTRQAREAVGAGRRAARDTRSDLERRVAEAKSALRSDAGTERDQTSPGPAGAGEMDVVVTEVIVEEDVTRTGLE